jgi:hypothetical protein
MRIMNKSIWPYQRTIEFQDLEHSDNMYNWCKKNVDHWYLNGNTFCFSNEQSFLLFCMKWS